MKRRILTNETAATLVRRRVRLQVVHCGHRITTTCPVQYLPGGGVARQTVINFNQATPFAVSRPGVERLKAAGDFFVVLPDPAYARLDVVC